MAKQSRSAPVMQAVLDAVAERLMAGDELLIRIPEICVATGVNYGSVYHHFGSREGVIDAAYNMIFSRLVDEDIEVFRRVNESVLSLEEYVQIMQPIVASLASGPERKARRSMRTRILAAATTRRELRALIGTTQADLTDEMLRLIQYSQGRGFLRSDIDAKALAVLFQILVFGRTLDDVSTSPINETAWESAISLLFLELLPR